MVVVGAYNTDSIVFPAPADSIELSTLAMIMQHASESHAAYARTVAAIPRGVAVGTATVAQEEDGEEQDDASANDQADAFAEIMRSDALTPLFNVVLVFRKSLVTPLDDAVAGPPFASFRAFSNLADKDCDYRKLIVG